MQPTNPEKIAQARRLRREAPFPERLLWGRLRHGQMSGYHFRRQHVVGPYITDFYCAHARLVIELDGQSHDGRRAYDEQRTRFLEAQGLRVIRFSDDQVIHELENVLLSIARELKPPGFEEQ